MVVGAFRSADGRVFVAVGKREREKEKGKRRINGLAGGREARSTVHDKNIKL